MIMFFELDRKNQWVGAIGGIDERKGQAALFKERGAIDNFIFLDECSCKYSKSQHRKASSLMNDMKRHRIPM